MEEIKIGYHRRMELYDVVESEYRRRLCLWVLLICDPHLANLELDSINPSSSPYMTLFSPSNQWKEEADHG